MSYIIAFFTISYLIMSFSLDWTTFNMLLVIAFFLSLSELLRNLAMILNKILNDTTLEKTLNLKLNLEKYHKELNNWSTSLSETSKDTVLLQIKSLYVLMMWSTQNNDELNFNRLIKKLKAMQVPDEYLYSAKKFEEFIEDVENNKYLVKFKKESGQPFFILKENNVSTQK